MAKETALLLMDLQRGIVERYGDEGYLERVVRARDAARHHGIAVIWVVVRFRPEYPEVSPHNRSFAAIRERGGMAEGEEAAAIHPRLQPLGNEIVVVKRRVSAFSGSDLEVVLRSNGISHLVLAGIATSGVVLSTVRQAADLDYRLTVLKDGTSDLDPEVHRVLTEKVFPRQADVVLIDEWVAGLNRG